jgi:hypothetical protein
VAVLESLLLIGARVAKDVADVAEEALQDAGAVTDASDSAEQSVPEMVEVGEAAVPQFQVLEVVGRQNLAQAGDRSGILDGCLRCFSSSSARSPV